MRQGKCSSVFLQLILCFSARKERLMSASKFLKNYGVAVFTMVALLVVAVPLAQATLVSEDFSTGPAGGLKSVVGGGSGWASSWGTDVGTASSNTLDATAYPDLAPSVASNYCIVQTTPKGYAQVLRYGTAPAWRGINRIVTTPLSGTVWFSALLANTDVGTGSVQLNAHAVTPAPAADYSEGNFEVGISNSQLSVLWGGVRTFDATSGHDLVRSTLDATNKYLTTAKTHLIVGKLTIGAGNDSVQVWADPTSLNDLDGTAKATLSATGADLGASLSLLGIGGGVPSTVPNGPPSTLFDALRFSDGTTAFTDVTGVTPTPEPGTMVLFITGLMGLLAYAWRKQK